MQVNENIRYIDFHTHFESTTDDTLSVVNLFPGSLIPHSTGNNYYSAGIHPWFIEPEMLDSQKAQVEESSMHPKVIVIGEAGFDRIKGPAPEIQYETFLFQAALADRTVKPMVIHCVRAYEQLLNAGKEAVKSTPWVIHGFRGKDQLAAVLAGRGFWFSLGMKGLSGSLLKALPIDRILLETDDTHGNIEDVYQKFSSLSGYDPDKTCEVIRNNFKSLFQI